MHLFEVAVGEELLIFLEEGLVKVSVGSIENESVHLGVDLPTITIPVLRMEVYDAIRAQERIKNKST